MNSIHGYSDRGFVLITVLVVMGGALLLATSLLFVAQAEIAGSAGTADAAQSRALAWSGVQAVVSRLNEQRSVILDGRMPRLDERYVIYEAGSRLGVVWLLPLGPDGGRLVPEAGKLDLNHVDAQMLTATGRIDEPLARTVIEYRDEQLGRPYQSVGELLRVPGLSPETLYGPIEELTVMDDATLGDHGVTERLSAGIVGNGPRGLGDVVTVYGFEPAIQQDTTRRINLNIQWSQELARRIEARFDREASEVLQRMLEGGTTFDTEAKLFQVLRFFDVPPEDWPQIIDAFTAEAGEFHFGRLDINTAPYEALVALPGLEPEQAARIVELRDDLPAQQRATIAWLAIQVIVQPEAYDELAGRITTRSWTYRVRLAAGEVGADSPDDPPAGAVIYEAVIDLSAPRPRVAFLRDITLLQTTAVLAVNASLDHVESSRRFAATDNEPSDYDAVATAGAGADSGPFEDDVTVTPTSSAKPGRRRIGRWIGGG
ncbi:MAG: helix-hairpin-helix domain-containing protein [Planctomycetota bacterium]|nr:helix-hairpin-helix domain-containing protein [Planctomycetota bacterium]